MVWPLLFFTLARNIIYPYAFPILPAFALLFSELLLRMFAKKRNPVYLVASIIGFIFLGATSLFIVNPSWVEKSQYRVVASWREHAVDAGSLIYWATTPDYSARFYAHGQVKATRDPNTLASWLSMPGVHFVVVNENELEQIPFELKHRLNLIDHIQVLKQNMILFKTKK